MADSPLVLRRLLPIGLACLLAATAPVLTAQSGPAPSIPNDDGSIRHVLNRLGFGARPGDLDRVRNLGLDRYIEQQLHPDTVPDDALDARLASLTTLTMSSRALADEFFLPAAELRRQQQAAVQTEPEMTPSPGAGRPEPARERLAPADQRTLQAAQRVPAELMQARLLRAVESERQLQEVLTDFWFNHFNVFIGKGQVRQYVTEYERDAIRPHVLGSFRELLGAVATSPAMLLYLDNWQSAAPGERNDVADNTRDIERRLSNTRLPIETRQRLTERLQRMQQARPARGLNENYARELLELHTLGVDGGYTQNDVIALARILTGWTIDQPRRGGSFTFRTEMHDTGTKTLLGRTFAPSGQAEGEFALDMLASHPATARHIAAKLAQRFVADEPPASLVDRAAAVFLQTGGNLRDVVRTIVTSPEFFAAEARRAKVKTPLEFVVSAVRTTGASTTSAQPLVNALRTLGMPLYGSQPPTGYGTSAADWVNTGALLARMNFAVDLVAGGRALTTDRGQGAGATARPALARRTQAEPIRMNLATLAPDTSIDTQNALIDTLLGGIASDATRQTLARGESPQQLIALALGSPEFQRR